MNHDEPGGEVCIPNIGGRPRGQRLVFGVVMAVAAVFVSVALIGTDTPRFARVFVGPLIWLSAVGILQYRGRT